MHIYLISLPRLREHQRRVCQSQKAESSGHDGTTALMDSQHLWFPVHNPQKTKPVTIQLWEGTQEAPLLAKKLLAANGY